MQAIVAVNQNWGIGYKGDLLFRISADLKRFKEFTTGHTIVYGRKTLETFPKKRPLPNRRNIILSRQHTLQVEGAEICHSLAEAAALLNDIEDAYVIGGASVYADLLPVCTSVLVTKVQVNCKADCFFEDLDAHPDWNIAEQSSPMQENDYTYQFITYTRNV